MQYLSVHHQCQMVSVFFFCWGGMSKKANGAVSGHTSHWACKHITPESHEIWWIRESGRGESLFDVSFYLHIHTQAGTLTHTASGHICIKCIGTHCSLRSTLEQSRNTDNRYYVGVLPKPPATTSSSLSLTPRNTWHSHNCLSRE